MWLKCGKKRKKMKWKWAGKWSILYSGYHGQQST